MLAEQIGMSHAVLWRFLRGKDMTGRNLDKVNQWLALAAPSEKR